ncbi:MAG TPA: ABC transporter permease [Phycisphaerae bacterium]|nr:ABC transporter permease [Phycisphaerae bacterium]
MPTVAGPRAHAVSVLTIAFLVAFVAAVVALIAADVFYTHPAAMLEVLGSREVRFAIFLSLVTSAASLVLVIGFSIPVGYALSRYRFPGSAVLDAVVDLPIVLPPVVIGVSLLVFFRTWLGQFIESVPGLQFVYTPQGIVLCQFMVSASYGIRGAKSAFDGVDRRLEHLALTLGCTHGRAFRMVALPMARNGLAAAAVMAWARAVGVFGPLMIFAGTVRMKTEVMPTTIFLELSIGRIEPALAVAMLMLVIAMVALTLIHWLGSRNRWWGP